MSYQIDTRDGGRDNLLPGRWLACLSMNGPAFAQGHGNTEDEAVAHLKQILKDEHPNVLWYQNLPVARRR